jgi:hypothetical protein
MLLERHDLHLRPLHKTKLAVPFETFGIYLPWAVNLEASTGLYGENCDRLHDCGAGSDTTNSWQLAIDIVIHYELKELVKVFTT